MVDVVNDITADWESLIRTYVPRIGSFPMCQGIGWSPSWKNLSLYLKLLACHSTDSATSSLPLTQFYLACESFLVYGTAISLGLPTYLLFLTAHLYTLVQGFISPGMLVSYNRKERLAALLDESQGELTNSPERLD